MVKEYSVKTSERNQFVDVTSLLDQALREAGIKEGFVTAFVPHTTAAVTINENADPSVRSDIQNALARLVPEGAGYAHAPGNPDTHSKASLR